MAMAAAMAVIRPEHAGRDRLPRFFAFTFVLDPFRSFLSLSDLEKGSASIVYAGKWYREVQKPKLKVFRT